MMRNIISTALVVALVLAGGQAMAVVTHFSDGFEAADGHTVVGAGTVGTNGWAITSGGGNNPAVIASSSGLTGQVADGTASGMVGGSGDASWVNSAGIAGGLDPSREYTLSWTQKVNIGNTPDVSGGFGFFNGGIRINNCIN